MPRAIATTATLTGCLSPSNPTHNLLRNLKTNFILSSSRSRCLARQPRPLSHLSVTTTLAVLANRQQQRVRVEDNLHRQPVSNSRYSPKCTTENNSHLRRWRSLAKQPPTNKTTILPIDELVHSSEVRPLTSIEAICRYGGR